MLTCVRSPEHRSIVSPDPTDTGPRSFCQISLSSSSGVNSDDGTPVAEKFAAHFAYLLKEGFAGAAGQRTQDNAAAARRALAPICRFHKGLHFVSSRLEGRASGTCKTRIFLPRRAGLAVSLPFSGRRRPTRHSPRREL